MYRTSQLKAPKVGGGGFFNTYSATVVRNRLSLAKTNCTAAPSLKTAAVPRARTK